MIQSFMQGYSRKSDITNEDVEPWLVPIAARKLSSDAISDAEKEQLLQFIREQL